jgi:hypothetical protein
VLHRLLGRLCNQPDRPVLHRQLWWKELNLP